jgi:hypothetical protein
MSMLDSHPLLKLSHPLLGFELSSISRTAAYDPGVVDGEVRLAKGPRVDEAGKVSQADHRVNLPLR